MGNERNDTWKEKDERWDDNFKKTLAFRQSLRTFASASLLTLVGRDGKDFARFLFKVRNFLGSPTSKVKAPLPDPDDDRPECDGLERRLSLKDETHIYFNQFYERTARQIDREDGLINQRQTWTLQVQAFIFAAWAFATQPTGKEPIWIVLIVLPAAGFIFAVTGFAGVHAAILSVQRLKRNYALRLLHEVDQMRPTGDETSSEQSHADSLSVEEKIPLGFELYWPTPYGTKIASKLGFSPSYGILRFLSYFWLLACCVCVSCCLWHSVGKPILAVWRPPAHGAAVRAAGPGAMALRTAESTAATTSEFATPTPTPKPTPTPTGGQP